MPKHGHKATKRHDAPSRAKLVKAQPKPQVRVKSTPKPKPKQQKKPKTQAQPKRPPQRKRGVKTNPLVMRGIVAALAVLAVAAVVRLVVFRKPSQPAPTAEPTIVLNAVRDAGEVLEEATADWRLFLVNAEHPMDPYVPADMHMLANGEYVDERCDPDLQRMFDAAREEGATPIVNSAYRSREQQQEVFDEAVANAMSNGLTEEEARQEAMRTVALPGTSEHETGLAIDVTSKEDTGNDNWQVNHWFEEHSWEYGWILRYPADKVDITGIDNEPWHFRYVGVEHAAAMHESGMCLEEYVESLEG